MLENKRLVMETLRITFADNSKIHVKREKIVSILESKSYDDGRHSITVNCYPERRFKSCIDVGDLPDNIPVLWVLLDSRSYATPVVMYEDLPDYMKRQKTPLVTIMFRKQGDTVFVFNAYWGARTPGLPDTIKSSKHKPEAIEFWKRHALVLKEYSEFEETVKPEWA